MLGVGYEFHSGSAKPKEPRFVPALSVSYNLAVGGFLTQMPLGNTYAHNGEISALKGSMSMKGYPF